MAKGRPINYDSPAPENGIAYRGFERLARDINSLASFLTEPKNPNRRKIVEDLLAIGESYAKSKIGPDETVRVISSINDKEGSNSEGWGVVKAAGNDVLFWEFGTGVVLMPGSHPQAAEFGIEPASFSENHAGWLVGKKLEKFKGQWPYRNQWTYGQAPRMAMWSAAKAMREAIPGVVSQITVFER